MLRCCAETTGCLAKRCTPVTQLTLVIIETRTRASCLYKTAFMVPWRYPFRCCLLIVKHGFICKGGCVCPHCLCLSWYIFSCFLLVVCYLEILSEIVTRFVFL